MSALDKNKIFFGLIHYILSEQSNVDWILKTSLVNFTGINSSVDNKKYKQNSVTDDIIEYIYQVKPYHVTFEQFIEKYSSKQDDVDITVQEENNITMNVRFDAITSEVDEQGDLTDYEYMDTHMANRLWYFKYADLKKIYGSDEKVLEYIKDVMNCHFKGITVDGSDFNIDKSGYDAFLYDSTLYDAPTITSDYCLVNYKEDLKYPYTKSFVKVGLKSFILDYNSTIYPTNITVYSEYMGEKTEIKDFVVENNLITFFSPIRQFEKLTIIHAVNKIRNGYIFVGHPFLESNDESNLRKFVSIDTTMYPIPDGDLGSKKVTVHIEYPNGSRVPTTNFEKLEDSIIVYDTLKENYHVILTVIDYKQIYDKIYTYEDCYGQSNNVISLDGNEFLRPYYEKERPSELCVSYPIHNLMIYTERNNTIQSLYSSDFKSSQYKLPINKSFVTKLSQDLNIGDKIIEVDNISKLIMPYIGDNLEKIPGKILVNSEIIEFYDFEKGDGCKGILKSIRRGAKGSYLAEKHSKDSIVYAYNEQTMLDTSSTSLNISTYITDKTENKFEIPGKYREAENIAVFKKPYIELLSDITFLGNSFNISSNNITLPTNVTINSELQYSTVYKNQILGIDLAGVSYEIAINNDCDNLNDLIKIIDAKIPDANGLYEYNNDNKISLSASEGKSIKIYNISGNPLQEMFGNVLVSSIKPETIWIDGYNGLIINGNSIIWGNDVNSIQWLKDNPKQGTLDDVVSTINNLFPVNTIVKANNRDGKLELISLINEEIIIENLTNQENIIDNLEILGLNNKIPTQKLFLNTNGQLNYFEDTPNKLGNIYIDDEKIYFKNIQRIINGKTTYYKISNYYTDKEYKAGQAIIISVKPEQLSPKEYTIDTINDCIYLKTAPKIGEIITVSNEK